MEVGETTWSDHWLTGACTPVLNSASRGVNVRSARPARPETFESARSAQAPPTGNSRTACSNRESRPGALTITVRFVRHRAQEFPKRLIRLPLSVVWLFHAVRCWLERRMATRQQEAVCTRLREMLAFSRRSGRRLDGVLRPTAVGDPELSQIENWASKPTRCRGMTMTRERHQRGRRKLLHGSVR
jgi:hypothetical protein